MCRWTHWLDSPLCVEDFPIENLPYGVFSRKFADPCKLKWKKKDKVRFDGVGEKSIGVRIGGMELSFSFLPLRTL